MDALKTTTAREISKDAVVEGVNVALHDGHGSLLSASQEEGMKAGDFYFKSNVLTHYERSSWFRRVILREREKMIVQVKNSVVMSCPYCGLPLLTSLDNAIISRNPLTLEKPTSCPYSSPSTHSFSVKDGIIIPAA